ncbi:MAG: PH domain-containing protein [Sedimentisphaerales bacterium]|nr:PH domain-containing protein [Sedimentisphaerales bacterium]
MDTSEKQEFSIKREKVARYFYYSYILMIIVVGIWIMGVGLILAILYALTLGLWLSKKQAQALKYWLDGSTLRADSGVFFLKRKAIPLDRVTDVVLAQGPLMKWCGLWELRIQTAGTGQAMPEVALYGLTQPEQVRDLLIKERDKIISHSH